MVTAHPVGGASHIEMESPAIRAHDRMNSIRLGVQLSLSLAVDIHKNPINITQFLVLFPEAFIKIPMTALLSLGN